VSIGYGVGTEWYWRGQTLGKRILRLRVIDEQGLQLRFSHIVARNSLRFVDSLPAFYLVGGVTTSLVSRRAQHVDDIAAHTIVVRRPKMSEPDLDQIIPDKFDSFREYPHIAARLRQHVSPREAGIVIQALLRRDNLESQARVHLFNAIASHFRATIEFPEEATLGLSDEQYVRNIGDVLFRAQTRQAKPRSPNTYPPTNL